MEEKKKERVWVFVTEMLQTTANYSDILNQIFLIASFQPSLVLADKYHYMKLIKFKNPYLML